MTEKTHQRVRDRQLGSRVYDLATELDEPTTLLPWARGETMALTPCDGGSGPTHRSWSGRKDAVTLKPNDIRIGRQAVNDVSERSALDSGSAGVPAGLGSRPIREIGWWLGSSSRGPENLSREESRTWHPALGKAISSPFLPQDLNRVHPPRAPTGSELSPEWGGVQDQGTITMMSGAPPTLAVAQTE